MEFQDAEQTKAGTSTTDTTHGLGGPSNLFRVGVKIPPFWPEEPQVWFAQVEGHFTLSGITTDTTKFYYVIAQLDNQYAAEVKDIITSPPATGKYETLKVELIKRLTASAEKRVQQLLIHEELGDRKPSQFLRHLRSLAGPKVPDDFLRTLWASRLPHNLQTVIATQPKTSSLEVVAELADSVYDIVPSVPQSTQVATVKSSTQVNDLVAEMSKQIASLTRQVASLRAGHSRSRSRSRSRHRPHYRTRSNSRSNGLCWYHNRFGTKANRCTTPCSFQSSAPSENTSGSRK